MNHAPKIRCYVRLTFNDRLFPAPVDLSVPALNYGDTAYVVNMVIPPFIETYKATPSGFYFFKRSTPSEESPYYPLTNYTPPQKEDEAGQ